MPVERIHVVGCGINVIVPPTDREWRTPRFLLVGRNFEQKNGPVVLRAFRRLRAQVPGARLDVVGGHPPLDEPDVTGHGLLRPYVAAEAKRLRELFSRATCHVAPSPCEPFGMANAEAAAAGIPSIATTVGGCREVVGDGAGRLVVPGDEDALLEAMRELSHPATARAAGEAAAIRARKFTWPAVARQMLLRSTCGHPWGWPS